MVCSSFLVIGIYFNICKGMVLNHTSFITNEKLAAKIKDGYYPFGYFAGSKLVGFVSLCDTDGGVYELSNLAVLPEYRHCGYGKALLDFCKDKVKALGGGKITVGIIEEGAVLKNWYAANGFIHTGVKRYEHLPFTVGYMDWEVN